MKIAVVVNIVSFILLNIHITGTANADNNVLIDNLIKDKINAGNKIIKIPSGIYSISKGIKIKNVEDISIIAAPNVVIKSSTNSPVFEISKSKRIKIKGFNISSVDPERQDSRIAFGFSASRTLESDENNTTTGIKVYDSSDIDISDCVVNGYYRGIYITAYSTTTNNIFVKNCTVIDCGYMSIAAYKVLKTGDKSKLNNIYIDNNKISSSEIGPTFIGVNNGHITRNAVIGNIIGVRIEQSNYNSIADNSIGKNLKMGLWIYNKSSNNIISNNIIYDNNLQEHIIKKIANKYKLDSNYVPGDLVCFDRVSKPIVDYYGHVSKTRSILVFNPDFWPYPTAYEHITPGNKFGTIDQDTLKKYWGIYFCQWSGVGIELRNGANYNNIINNHIYNSIPVSPSTGYMHYAIRFSQLGLIKNTDSYASRGNVLKGNIFENMVKGNILDDNKRIKINIKNDY